VGGFELSLKSRTLVEWKYESHTALEWGGEAKHPVSGMAEPFGFIRGVFS